MCVYIYCFIDAASWVQMASGPFVVHQCQMVTLMAENIDCLNKLRQDFMSTDEMDLRVFSSGIEWMKTHYLIQAAGDLQEAVRLVSQKTMRLIPASWESWVNTRNVPMIKAQLLEKSVVKKVTDGTDCVVMGARQLSVITSTWPTKLGCTMPADMLALQKKVDQHVLRVKTYSAVQKALSLLVFNFKQKQSTATSRSASVRELLHPHPMLAILFVYIYTYIYVCVSSFSQIRHVDHATLHEACIALSMSTRYSRSIGTCVFSCAHDDPLTPQTSR